MIWHHHKLFHLHISLSCLPHTNEHKMIPPNWPNTNNFHRSRFIVSLDGLMQIDRSRWFGDNDDVFRSSHTGKCSEHCCRSHSTHRMIAWRWYMMDERRRASVRGQVWRVWSGTEPCRQWRERETRQKWPYETMLQIFRCQYQRKRDRIRTSCLKQQQGAQKMSVPAQKSCEFGNYSARKPKRSRRWRSLPGGRMGYLVVWNVAVLARHSCHTRYWK